MMRKTLLSLAPAVMTVLLAGCASVKIGSGSLFTTGSAGTVPVSITMTDDPPAGVRVLFFQVNLTAATLAPAPTTTGTTASPVSLLSNNTPIQIDVTQLQALSAFLSTADVTAGTYNSLSLTFANPELVIFNQSDSSLGSTCAVGSVCQLTPAIDNSATVAFSSSPFPVTVAPGSPLGFLIDFHLNTVIQSDLSVNLGVANGITVAQLPPAPTPPQFGSVTGEVESVSASNNQFTMLTAWGRTFTVDTTSSTTFSDFPASACTTAGIGCVASGQVVKVQVASFAKGGVLTASQVAYVQAAGTQTVEGTVIDILPLPVPSGELIVQMILHNNPASTSGVPLGGLATVTLASSATYSIDNNGFTIPSGLSFTGPEGVTVGQNLQVVVEPGTLSSSGSGWTIFGPPQTVTFTTTSVELEPSQMTGTISATDSSTTSFALGAGGPFFAPWPMPNAVSSYDVATTSQTTFTGFSPDNFGGLADVQFVSVSGWLFLGTTSDTPNVAAQSVVLRPTPSWF